MTLDRETIRGKYNNLTTGKYKPNTSKEIGSDDHRDMVDDFTDSLTWTKYASPSVGGSTVTLDFANADRGIFILGSFGTAKVIALANNSNAKEMKIIFPISNVAGTLTFPAGFKASDTRFTTLVFTALSTGIYKATAEFDGTSWIIDFSQEPYA